MSGFCIKDGQTILFIGDSITDCGRRGSEAPLGNGYVRLFSELVTVRFPERMIYYINKGIGGNRVTDLKERWQDDVLVHKPDWLSVKIGINDLHSYLGQPDSGVSPKIFEETYDFILREAPTSNIILIDPFYISRDRSGQTFRSKVMHLIPQYIDVVHKMSEKYKTKLIRTHDIFQKHLQYRDSDTFCPEPVHPNHTGHLIIAEELFKVLPE